VIVLAQFAGTSLWFAGNAVLRDLQPLPGGSGWITSAVQLGFVAGTLCYALLGIADRFPTTRVFLLSVFLAALANVGWLPFPPEAPIILFSRFLTGFFLAGVYPVGMKIAADWFRPVLGRAMGLLVGALVLGTAFPHLLRGLDQHWPYRTVLLVVSGIALAGGLLLAAVVPSRPVQGLTTRFDSRALAVLARPSPLRSAALGYFGHMWELYTFWAFLPVILTMYRRLHPDVSVDSSLGTFAVIAMGFLGCTLGGLAALRIGSPRVAFGQLLSSGLCIALLPLLLHAPPAVFAPYLLLWGATASGDSPQFSTLVSQHAPVEVRGSLLALVTSLGFGLTVVSIQLLDAVLGQTPTPWAFWLLVPGPVAGLWAMRRFFTDVGRWTYDV